MRATFIPISRATTLIPFIEFMDQLGAPVERELERCHLPADLLTQPESYVSTLKNWEWVSRMASSQAIDDFGLRVSHERIHQVLGPTLLRKLSSSPTLLGALQNFESLCRSASSGMTVWLSRHDEHLRFFLLKSFGPESPGYRQTEWLGLIGMLEVVRLFAGTAWKPDLISLRSTATVPPLALEIFPDTQFLTEQPTTFFTLPASLLSLGPCEHATRRIPRSESEANVAFGSSPATDLTASLQEILRAYLPSSLPSLELAAEIAGMSSRTLQRRLAKQGLSYRRLINQVRFGVAAKLLAESDASSMEISLATGYSNPSHFSRAFRHLAGCSPLEFRRQQGATVSRAGFQNPESLDPQAHS